MEVRLGIELGLVAIEVLRVRLVILRDRVTGRLPKYLVARVEVGGVVSILGVIELVVLVVRKLVVHWFRESPEASRRSATRLQVLNLSLHGFGHVLIHPCRCRSRCFGAASGGGVGLRENRPSRVVVHVLEEERSFSVLEVAVDVGSDLCLVFPEAFGGTCRVWSSPCITVQLAPTRVAEGSSPLPRTGPGDCLGTSSLGLPLSFDPDARARSEAGRGACCPGWLPSPARSSWHNPLGCPCT